MIPTFYCIKLINKHTGSRGYVIDSPKGIQVAEKFVSDCVRFPTYQEAQKFMRDNKLERGGITAYIRDNQDVMKEGEASGLVKVESDQPIYFIENEIGQKLFYDTKEDGYYFSDEDIGYCCWYDIPTADKFVEAYKKSYPSLVMIIKEITKPTKN